MGESVRGKSPRDGLRDAWPIVAVVGLLVLDYVARVSAPSLVPDDPGLLLTISARPEYQILAAPFLAVVPFVAIALVRKAAGDGLYFAAGRTAGERVIEWLERGNRETVTTVRQFVQRLIRPALIVLPGSVVCTLAGTTSIGIGWFAALDLVGSVLRLIAFRLLADRFGHTIREFVTWMSDHQLEVTAGLVIVVALQLLARRFGPNSRTVTSRERIAP